MKFIKPIFIAVLFFASNGILAQRQKNATANTNVKYQVPKLTTLLGSYKDSMHVAAEILDSIVGLSIKVVDAKNNPYSISSYQFLYKKIVTTEDEETGKTSKTTSVKSSLFKTSPFPELWLNAIRENLKSGEELFFFAVIVKDEKGRIMYAPDLKLIVK